jgi:hypothetical protein
MEFAESYPEARTMSQAKVHTQKMKSQCLSLGYRSKASEIVKDMTGEEIG